MQVLEFLQNVVHKFPAAVVSVRCAFFFLPLVARLVNDESPKARAQVAATLTALLKRVNAASVDECAQTCLDWLACDDTRLRRAAVQVWLCFFLLVLPQGCKGT